MTILGQDRIVLWFQPGGPGTAYIPYGTGEKSGGMTGKSIPGPGRTPVYGRDSSGNPVVIKMTREAPGDLPAATLTLFERGQVDLLRKSLQRGCPINVQARIVTCGPLTNPNVWDAIDHWGNGEITEYTQSDGPSTVYDGTEMTVEATVNFTHSIRIVDTELSRLTTAETGALLDIAGISEETCNACGTGYPGADKIMFIGAAGAPGNVLYTETGGSSWAATSAAPFTAEDASLIAAGFIDADTIRIIAATKTADVASKAQFAYADVDLGALGTTTWTVSIIANTALNDVFEAMDWVDYDLVMMAANGDIYISYDQAATDPGSPVYTGAVAIAGFIISPDKSVVWAFGASNLILQGTRADDNTVSFATRVGPSGGGAFTALAQAGDGRLYAGNGQSIFVSINGAANAGGWTSLKDFGANKVVTGIQVIGGERALGGDSQLIRVVVDDTAGGNGQVWLSVDGGATFRQATELTNLGYNATYFSRIDDNLATIVGDVVTGTGLIHRLAEKVS